jgi:hypothetical protein
MFLGSKPPTARKVIDMYERIADKITKFILDLLKKEKMLDIALKSEARPGSKRITKSLSKCAGRSTYDSEWVNKEIRNVRPRWSQKNVSFLETVIQKMLDANSPSHKAHATRALNNYSKKRAAEIGSTPKRVVAGVKAAVTKRIKSKGSSTCSTN